MNVTNDTEKVTWRPSSLFIKKSSETNQKQAGAGVLQTILSPKVALWNTHKILCLLLFILWFRGVKLNRRLKKQRSRMYSAAKKPSKTDSVSLLFITKDVWGMNDLFHKKKHAYNSEILWKINFITIFFRDWLSIYFCARLDGTWEWRVQACISLAV